MTITLPFIIESLGTLAFAISGIRLAAAKQFDWFGAYVVGLITAIGGGTIRDLLLDQTAFWMLSSVYLNNTFFIFDTIGLALFVVVGIQKTVDAGYPFWVAIIMGTITGAAGGVLRDILINEVPLIFHKEIYALACVFGGIVFGICLHYGCAQNLTQILAAIAVIASRVIAVKYKLSLPHLHDESETLDNDQP